jgi:hypothetical protein
MHAAALALFSVMPSMGAVGFDTGDKANDVGLVTGIRGEVTIRFAGKTARTLLKTSALLRPNDEVSAGKNGTAVVYLINKQIQRVRPGEKIVASSPKTLLSGGLPPGEFASLRNRLMFTAGLGAVGLDGGGRASEAPRAPLMTAPKPLVDSRTPRPLLWPSMNLLLDPTPQFEWVPQLGVSSYRIIVADSRGKKWTTNALGSVTSAKASTPLAPGSYRVILQSVIGEYAESIDESTFEVATPEKAKAVQAAIGKPDPTLEGLDVLYANRLIDEGLYKEADELLSEELKRNPFDQLIFDMRMSLMSEMQRYSDSGF